MKRFTMILALVAMISMPMFAERITPETARKVAETFMQVRSGEKAELHLINYADRDAFPNFYVFGTDNSFIIISADDCVQPVLGYSFSNPFGTEKMPENVYSWLKGYDVMIESQIVSQEKASLETAKQWNNLMNGQDIERKYRSAVSPMLSINWDQNSPYNLYAPAASGGPGGHCYAGCVATALAQIMKYHNYPTTGIGTHTYTHTTFGDLSANFGTTTYQWNNMPTSLSNANQSQIEAVAQLIYHCSIMVDMNFSANGSGAPTYKAANGLIQHFNYDSNLQYVKKDDYEDPNDWLNLLTAELNQSRPVFYAGGYYENNEYGGHAFVCDGYDENGKFHFNWGWSGRKNGYFSIGSLNPGGGESGSGSGTYNVENEAIIGIQPSPCTASAPINLTYQLTGLQNITLNWDAGNGATSYNIYRNDNYISNTTSTTYCENAPIGTNIYYIRSVDSNGILSLASNPIIVTIDFQTPVVNDLEATLSNNTVNLVWTAPEWCYPEAPSATLKYGTQVPLNAYMNWSSSRVYWGHRHLSENLSDYDGMKLYSVDFYASNAGSYELCIYEGTTSSDDYVVPETQISTQTLTIAATGWYSIDLPIPYVIDKTKDLWIFIHNPQIINGLKVFLCTSSGSYGCYYSGAPLSYTYNNLTDYAFLIKAYITDGTYTYNLYQDGIEIAENLSNTTYSTTLNNNAANQFTVKTNYYGSETEASNMVGFSKGIALLSDLVMDTNDKMTLTEGSKLTVNGTLSNNMADHLILEDGAQLIHSSDNVKATAKKNITGYSGEDDGWYFIASPVIESVTPSIDNGLLANSYDFYKFDQSQENEWLNIESNSFSTIDYKTGYLYANSGNPTLTFAGTLVANTAATPLTYYDNVEFPGFNLIGNPYPCNATVDKDFFVIADGKVILADANAVIAPCEGVFVKATSTGQNATFTKANAAKGNHAKECVDIVVKQEKTTIDRARVRLGEGNGVEKFSLNDNSSQISLLHNGQNYAVAYTNGQTEIPVSFKATQNGTYMLSFETNNLELDYLHLIDNMTGDDIDILTTLHYTFEAKTSDYASRFKLVFSNGEDTVDDNEAFAFVSNGEIVINQEGTIQIVDMTGRMVFSHCGRIQCVPTRGMAQGVYVLRLINGNNVKTQKIMID